MITSAPESAARAARSKRRAGRRADEVIAYADADMNVAPEHLGAGAAPARRGRGPGRRPARPVRVRLGRGPAAAARRRPGAAHAAGAGDVERSATPSAASRSFAEPLARVGVLAQTRISFVRLRHRSAVPGPQAWRAHRRNAGAHHVSRGVDVQRAQAPAAASCATSCRFASTTWPAGTVPPAANIGAVPTLSPQRPLRLSLTAEGAMYSPGEQYRLLDVARAADEAGRRLRRHHRARADGPGCARGRPGLGAAPPRAAAARSRW